jgi:hypothetical protein
MRRAGWSWLVLAAALAGCNQPPTKPADTGARAAAQGFADALRVRAWSEAYDRLHAESQARYSRGEFQRRAEQYHHDLGFEPQAVHVVACGERGQEALAHIVFTGQVTGHHRRFKDLVVLRPGETGWEVVLPAHFGRGRNAEGR